MPFYEYECEACRLRTAMRFGMGHAPKSVSCRACGTRAHRVFTIGGIKTDTNNPLRAYGRMLGADMDTRAGAASVMDSRGLVMASERECEGAARSVHNEARRLDEKVADGVRAYNKLPPAMRAKDAQNVAADKDGRAKRVTRSAPLGP